MENFPPRIAHPSGVELRLERDRVVVTLDEGPAASAADPLAELGLVPERDAKAFAANAVGDPTQVVNDSERRTWARTADGSAVAAPALADERPNGVASIGPVYTGNFDGEEVVVGVCPEVLLVTPSGSVADASAALADLGLEVDVERSEYLGKELFCRVEDPLSASSIDMVERVTASEHVAFARLEIMPLNRPHAYLPNDPEFADQWNVRQIRAGGSGHTGWNDQRGDAAIVIGVLDDGVDRQHEDLRFAGPGFNLGTMIPGGQPRTRRDNHGTACAGCAAATIDNGQGVAGVAGGCSILPIRFESWSDTEVAVGIRWAAQNGVHVLSMSFGSNAWDRTVIDPAIQAAYDAGVVMCAATHNHNRRGITYPATHPLVIACGASDQVDDRKSPTSPDGETWWGSNFGPEISVVAPGVLIPTTDRTGNVGYTRDNYTPDFNGTSSATPQVAGLAALLLSCDDSLHPSEVRSLIETTAAKTGTTPYVTTQGKPNGTWNERMGYGRIDVEAAVHRLCNPRPTFPTIIDWRHIAQLLELKIERVKEKERIEEVKLLDGRELDGLQVGLDELVQPIDEIDLPGRIFIDVADRAPVGDRLARRVTRRR